MPYRGAFHGIKEVTARNNKKYHVATVGDAEMSIWDADVAAGLQGLPIGSEIEYETRQTGNYTNVTSFRPLDAGPPLGATDTQGNPYIRRMSALKNATLTLDGYTDMSPREQATTVLKIARKFEKYTEGGLDDADLDTFFDDVFREPGQDG